MTPLRCDYRNNYQEAGGSLRECELFLFDPPLKNYFNIYVVVNFLSQVIFLFLLLLGMVMYANAVETKEK